MAFISGNGTGLYGLNSAQYYSYSEVGSASMAGITGSTAVRVLPFVVTTGSTPSEVSGGVTTAQWFDTFGRVVGKTDDLSVGATQVEDISPALTQNINVVNLNAVGSVTGSNVGAWVNMVNYANKSIYFIYTSGGTGAMVVNIDVSPNAGSNYVTIGSQVFTGTTSNTLVTNTNHHEYMRTWTAVNSGGTLTTIITGRGG